MNQDAVTEVGPCRPRWTHIALRVGDIEQSIGWYQRFTPLRVLRRSGDEYGVGAWLADPADASQPFVLVLSQFDPELDPFGFAPPTVMGPYAHLGFEVERREDVDVTAELARSDGSLTLPPTQMPAPIGYVCFVEDPDGNTVEFSHDQGMNASIRDIWRGGS